MLTERGNYRRIPLTSREAVEEVRHIARTSLPREERDTVLTKCEAIEAVMVRGEDENDFGVTTPYFEASVSLLDTVGMPLLIRCCEFIDKRLLEVWRERRRLGAHEHDCSDHVRQELKERYPEIGNRAIGIWLLHGHAGIMTQESTGGWRHPRDINWSDVISDWYQKEVAKQVRKKLFKS